jgi:hypothetical protein
MIEILNKTDINKIQNEKLKNHLYKSFERLTKEFDYPNDGYFVVIENQNEIKSTPITLSTYKLNSLDEDLYDDINMVEIEDGVMEILVFIDNDVNVAFVMLEDILDEEIKEKLQEYVI